jgi:hypothetical protein
MADWNNVDDHVWNPSTKRRNLNFGMLVFPILGLLAFELTRNPMIGMFITCLKSGVEETRTAFWLVRFDTERGRGWACFWLFLTAGFWKTFALSFVLVVVLLIVSESFGGGDFVKASLSGSVYATLFGFLALMLTSSLAVGSALLTRTQVWVSRDVHRARRAGLWPPSLSVRHGAMNHTYGLLLPFQVVLCLSLVAFCIMMHSAAAVLAVIPGCVGILKLQDAITQRLVAHDAYSCWPVSELVPQADVHETTRWD